MNKKMGPTEMKAEVERLQAAGKMPSLEDLLAVIGDVRSEYAPQILKSRQGEKNASDAK
jgi:hypothetical protein